MNINAFQHFFKIPDYSFELKVLFFCVNTIDLIRSREMSVYSLRLYIAVAQGSCD